MDLCLSEVEVYIGLRQENLLKRWVHICNDLKELLKGINALIFNKKKER